MDIAISIIVAVYNLEKYLPTCVESILSQTFTNFELILVNDGSTDDSGEICDQYAKLDSRVKVIHKENGGTASSRNAGIDIAKGNYIGFVDNDDYINQSMFEILYDHAIKDSADMVVCDFLDIDEGTSIHTKEVDSNYNIMHLSNIEALNYIYTEEGGRFIVPWNKLYKRNLFENIKYEVGKLHEDETVAHKLLYECEKITYVKTKLYYYVDRQGSITNTTYNIRGFEVVYTFSDRADFFRKKNELDLHEKTLERYLQLFFWNYHMAKENLKDIDKELKKLKGTFDKNLIYLLKDKKYRLGEKIYFVLFRISPSLYDFVLNIRKKGQNTTQEHR